MADLKDGGEFLERGIGMLFNVRLKFLGIERAPLAPAGFRGERPGLGGGEVAINRAPGQREVAGRFDLGAARLKKLHHPFPQIQRISFHAQSLPPYVPMSMLIAIAAEVTRLHTKWHMGKWELSSHDRFSLSDFLIGSLSA
jgi:hypothetical protein